LAASAFAQRIAIGAPADQASISPGQSITVEVDRPNSLTGSQEVAIAITLVSCTSFPDGQCGSVDTSQRLGTTLYSGSYNPQYQQGAFSKPPHQNFTVTVPETIAQGQASLSVVHLSLVGAGPFPFLEVANRTLNV
ncbi:hypothetical protein K474DRAFT_1559154, partial [Panus rudis PR-1116 ss-1]